jgi:hypothetical protein
VSDVDLDNLFCCCLVDILVVGKLLNLLFAVRREDQFVIDEIEADLGIENVVGVFSADKFFFLVFTLFFLVDVDVSIKLDLFFLSNCWNFVLILSASELLLGEGFIVVLIISAGATLLLFAFLLL